MPMRLGTPLPSLEGATWWWHTAGGPPALGAARATLVHFWAVSCHICHETMDDVVAMADRYRSEGLQVVALHLPRMPEDADEARVQGDIESYHMEQPVGLDHLHRVADRFENLYVPAFFVFGPDGRLMFRAAGDKGFLKVEPKIQAALGLLSEV